MAIITSIQKVLITGGEGYLGAVLTPFLSSRGYTVHTLDTGFYREGLLFPEPSPRVPGMSKDIRRLTEQDLRGFDAVVHLGELSNDPSAELSPQITFAINHEGSVHLARLARSAGVQRFVFSSSCSVYGVAENTEVTEDSPARPQTAYAECKTRVERDLQALASESFSPVFLRNATAYGASPRMRFDLVLNNLAGMAWTGRRIVLTSDGSPWRPLIHAEDIAQAVALALQAPREAVHNEIFNVGSDDQNYQVRDIARIVAEVFPGCERVLGPAGSDQRSYRVSFRKIRRHLPAFQCRWDAASGARQLRDLFEHLHLTEETFQFRAYTRLKQLKYLLDTGGIDPSFFWTDPQMPHDPNP
jgi:nucleoside-diphosphate-sugar epimerase